VAQVQRRAQLPNASRRRADIPPAAKRRGTGRTERGRQSRQQLVDAARTIFERDGFLRARIADICDEAQTAYGSFYTYFVSKEEIFHEVVDSVEIDLLRLEPFPEDAKPIERIRAANRHYLETYQRNAGILRVIMQVSTFDDAVSGTRVLRQDEFARAIERRTRVYQEQGVADPDLDPWLAANALGGMVAFIAEKVVAGDAPMDIDDAVDQLTKLWANAIKLKE
jgi:AcrR family transcriptional regulator